MTLFSVRVAPFSSIRNWTYDLNTLHLLYLANLRDKYYYSLRHIGKWELDLWFFFCFSFFHNLHTLVVTEHRQRWEVRASLVATSLCVRVEVVTHNSSKYKKHLYFVVVTRMISFFFPFIVIKKTRNMSSVLLTNMYC